MQDEHPRFLMSDSWQIISEKAGDLNPSGKWFRQPGESRLSATCGPSCRREHLQPAWLPQSRTLVLLLPNSAFVLWCKFRGKCSGQHGLQRKNISQVYHCLLSFPFERQSGHALSFTVKKRVQPRSSQFTKQETAATAAKYSAIWQCQTPSKPSLPTTRSSDIPLRRSLYTFPLPSQKLCEAWARSSSISDPRAQDRTQHTVGSLLMSAGHWRQKWPVFPVFHLFLWAFGNAFCISLITSLV